MRGKRAVCANDFQQSVADAIANITETVVKRANVGFWQVNACKERVIGGCGITEFRFESSNLEFVFSFCDNVQHTTEHNCMVKKKETSDNESQCIKVSWCNLEKNL